MKIILTLAALIIIAIVGFFSFNQKDNQALKSETTQKSEAGVDYQSEIIAGTTSQYRTFSKVEYDKAKSEGKIIFLNFYANWCPICRAEAPDIAAGFNELNNPNIVGFRVNYKDDETDNTEKELANQFQITYQHSKVIIKEDQILYKQIAEKWDKGKVIKELTHR